MPAPKGGNRGSIKPGEKRALGNDKAVRISTWLDKALDKTVPESMSVEHYEAQISLRQYIAEQMVIRAATDPKQALDYLKEVLDRTEGKPKQQTDITSDGEKIQMVIYQPEKYADPDAE